MSREDILGRVKEALSNPSDPHVRSQVSQAAGRLPVLANGPQGRSQQVASFLPFVGPTFEDRIESFRTISSKLQTEFICVDDLAAAQQTIRDLAQKHQWRRAGIHHSELLSGCTQSVELEFLNTSDTYHVDDLEACDVGISACDALIAQTASVLVTAKSAGGRGLSVLPPHHVVVATREQMVATMTDGYEILRNQYLGQWPSFVSFITGPSRTADIERVLVLGAHGPKKLTVILITSPQ